jgi:predicted RNA-binding protein with PIN domain
MQKVIVDGYNVIHADERLKQTAARDLEGARGQLVGRVKRYLKHKRVQITIVFDGAGGLTEVEPVVPGKLQVLFSNTLQTADELILKTLGDANNPRAFIVVTSDMTDIGRCAREMGAEVVGSREFLKRIGGKTGKRPRGGADGNKKTIEPGEQDVDYWMDQFAGKPPPNAENEGREDG